MYINQSERITTQEASNLNSKYPRGMNLKFGSETHNKLLTKIKENVLHARKNINKRFGVWRELDRVLTSYVQLDKKELNIQEMDPRKPIRVVIPASQASLDILLTYMTAAFLDGPIYEYFPQEGSKQELGRVKLLQGTVNSHAHRFRHALRLHTMWRDEIVYGFGPIFIKWDKKEYYRTVREELLKESYRQSTKAFVKTATGDYSESRELSGYYGSNLVNINPYNCFFDSNVPIDRFQEGEFFGWISRKSLITFMNLAKNGGFFNIEEVYNRRSLLSRNYKESEHEQTGQTTRQPVDRSYTVDLVYYYTTLIPKMAGLGSSLIPEKWLFVVAGDQVICKAEKLNYNHNMYPAAVDAVTYDGHSTFPVSIMETVQGLQRQMDWDFATATANRRKALHDMFVVDPFLVNINDVINPSPMKVIRMRRNTMGMGVENAIKQLEVQDVTQNYIQNIQATMNLFDLGTGAVDSIKGLRRRTSERVTATEVQADTGSALSRLEKMARLSALQAYYDIAFQVACNTQQFMTDEQYIQILGDDIQAMAKDYGTTLVKPEELNVLFDVKIKDGAVPRSDNVQTWTQLYQVLTGNPELMQQFDMVKIFKHIARLLGAKNVGEFEVREEVVPDEVAAQQAEAGNIVPVEEGITMGA